MKRRQSKKQFSKPSVQPLEARRLMAVDLSALTPVNPDVMPGHYLTERPSISQTIPSRTFNVVGSLTNGSASLADSGAQMRHVEQAAVDQLHLELGSQDELLSDIVTEAAIGSIDALASDIVGQSGLIPGLDSLGGSSLQSFFGGGLADIHGHSVGGGRQLLGGIAGFFGDSGADNSATKIPLPNQGFAMNGSGGHTSNGFMPWPGSEPDGPGGQTSNGFMPWPGSEPDGPSGHTSNGFMPWPGSEPDAPGGQTSNGFMSWPDGVKKQKNSLGDGPREQIVPYSEEDANDANVIRWYTTPEVVTPSSGGKDGPTKSWFGGDEDDDEDQAPDSVDDDDTTKPNPEDDYAPVINREWAQQYVEEEMEFRESLTINPGPDDLGELGDNVVIPPGLLGETPTRAPGRQPLGWVILVRWELDSSGSRAGSLPDHVMPGYGHTDPSPDAVDGVSDAMKEIIENGEQMELQRAMQERQYSFNHAKDDDDK